jgi:3-isopropylmalate dehydrogenase
MMPPTAAPPSAPRTVPVWALGPEAQDTKEAPHNKVRTKFFMVMDLIRGFTRNGESRTETTYVGSHSKGKIKFSQEQKSDGMNGGWAEAFEGLYSLLALAGIFVQLPGHMSPNYSIAVLSGDGIGPEVMGEALQVLEAVASKSGFGFTFNHQLVGGAAIDAVGKALPEETIAACEASDAILFGSVGGPKWEHLPPNEQPERGALLPIRKHFGLFANLRPGICYPALTASSPIRPDLVEGGFDVLCVRELTGGLYFGQPKLRETLPDGDVRVVDTMVYKKSEIERIGHVAFKAAQGRGRHVTSVDKANVLTNSVLWRETMIEVAKQYPDVKLSHLYVDNAAMQLIKAPRSFDVMVTENLFGDILSDEMAMIAGSLGMLASASLGQPKGDGLYFGLYEPSGGTAPDIAGKGIANPIAQILSAALLLRFSLGLESEAAAIELAVRQVIGEGLRTGDIYTGATGTRLVNTEEMGAAIKAALP